LACRRASVRVTQAARASCGCHHVLESLVTDRPAVTVSRQRRPRPPPRQLASDAAAAASPAEPDSTGSSPSHGHGSHGRVTVPGRQLESSSDRRRHVQNTSRVMVDSAATMIVAVDLRRPGRAECRPAAAASALRANSITRLETSLILLLNEFRFLKRYCRHCCKESL
jgi:hypothetical protein